MTHMATNIAAAASAPIGSSVRVVGMVSAVRQLGKLTFLTVRDSFSEIQAVATGAIQLTLKNEAYPFYATVSGVLRQRPLPARRPDSINGLVEIETDALHVHRHIGWRPLNAGLGELLRLLAFLQSRGFLDARTLARAAAPSYSDLITGDDPRPLRHLTYILGPCRWYFVADGFLHFGLSPGFIVDLQRLLSVGELDECSIARQFLERAIWRQDHADMSSDLVPMAYGVIEIRSLQEDIGAMASNAYWRGSRSIVHLSDNLLINAAGRPIGDVAAQTKEESLDRGQALLQGVLGSRGHGDSSIVLRDIPEFDLHGRHIAQLIGLFPSLKRYLARSDIEHQFEILWSLLGHDHVKDICSSQRAIDLLSACVRSRLFTDYNVLRCLDLTALESLATLTLDFSCPHSIKAIEQLFRSTPSVASSAVYLMTRVDQLGLDWKRCVDVAMRGIISELASTAAALDVASTEDIVSWRSALASVLRKLYTNDPVDETFCRSALSDLATQFPWIDRTLEACRCDDIIFDLVNLTFGNGLLAYEEAGRLFSRTIDCSEHWHLARIGFAGERWDGGEKRFNLTDFVLYPSKNRAAVLAKSCSGICSARDFDLFHRKDHFQFTLVQPSEPVVAGTVQLYCCQDEKGCEIWVVRGLNPSERMSVNPAVFTFEVLDTLASLARHNNVSALVFADGAGLFNADSARIQLRTVIRRLASRAKRITFRKPLHLFDYHDRPIHVEFGWQVWP